MPPAACQCLFWRSRVRVRFATEPTCAPSKSRPQIRHGYREEDEGFSYGVTEILENCGGFC